jgi:hypothetical protein
MVRDDRGNFLAASNNMVDHAMDVATTEALEIRYGLYLANQLGVNKVMIQSDFHEAVEIMRDGGFSSTVAAPILEIICVQAQLSVKLFFFPRNANKVAHILATNVFLNRMLV